jgi:hypothetical protein
MSDQPSANPFRMSAVVFRQNGDRVPSLVVYDGVCHIDVECKRCCNYSHYPQRPWYEKKVTRVTRLLSGCNSTHTVSTCRYKSTSFTSYQCRNVSDTPLSEIFLCNNASATGSITDMCVGDLVRCVVITRRCRLFYRDLQLSGTLPTAFAQLSALTLL